MSEALCGQVVDLSVTDATMSRTRALYIGVSGDVKVDCSVSGAGLVFKAVPVGIFPVSVVKVYKTGTTATDIIGLA